MSARGARHSARASGPTDAASPPARLERADKVRNRQRIIGAASAVFAEKGMDAQMDEIAARAGLGVGTIYRHFATKEELMGAMVDRKFEQIAEVTREALAQESAEPFEVFAELLRRCAKIMADDAGTSRALARVGRAVWSQFAPIPSEVVSSTQIVIDRAQAAGSLRPDIDFDDVPPILAAVSATPEASRRGWLRYLEIMIDGLRTGEVAHAHPPLAGIEPATRHATAP